MFKIADKEDITIVTVNGVKYRCVNNPSYLFDGEPIPCVYGDAYISEDGETFLWSADNDEKVAMRIGKLDPVEDIKEKKRDPVKTHLGTFPWWIIYVRRLLWLGSLVFLIWGIFGFVDFIMKAYV